MLRPPISQERVEAGHDGLVRIALERAYADGTVAVAMVPLSLLCRLATSVPPPRYHIVKYAGVLASASPWRSRIAPRPKPASAIDAPDGVPEHEPGVSDPPDQEPPRRANGVYRAWAGLLARTLQVDVLECQSCKGRMKLLAIVTQPRSITRYLAALGEPHKRARALPGPRAPLLEKHRAAP